MGEELSIGFRCPPDAAPAREGQHVVLYGLVSARPSTVKASALQVIVEGTYQGTWVPDEKARNIVRITQRRSQIVRLFDFLETQPLSELLVIGTETGMQDTRSALARHFGDTTDEVLQTAVGNFGSSEGLIVSLNAATEATQPQALALVRGGGDERTLRIWDDPALVNHVLKLGIPVFTAIGHSDAHRLIDKYSDEAFPTPTAFGDAIGGVLVRIHHARSRDKELAESEEENKRLSAQIQEQHRKLTDEFARREQSVWDKVRLWRKIALSALAVAVLAFAWIWRDELAQLMLKTIQGGS